MLASIFSRAAWQLGAGALVGALLGAALLLGTGKAALGEAAILRARSLPSSLRRG